MAATTNGSATDQQNSFANWLDNVTLEKAVREAIGEYVKIKSTNVESVRKSDEGSPTLMLRVGVEAELKDNSTKSISFILKAPHSNEAMTKILNKLQLFAKEEQMYHKIIPKFEHIYKDAGATIRFAPKAYKFDRDLGMDYVLLEDLRSSGYKNANNASGFDMEHMKQVLTKLAQFHAASACYVEHFGMYGSEFTTGLFSETNREMLKEFNNSEAFLNQLKKWKNGQQYYEKLADSDDYLVARLLEDQKVNPREFNVLNHGDCWLNNIMFQYDAFGKIKNTLFVDFQVGKYGSPANDLYYLILSSADMSIKLAEFDYLVRFYYDNLVEHLKLLQYHRPLPKLQGIHAALLKNGLAAYLVVSKVLPIVMLEKSQHIQLDSLKSDELKLKSAMYTNNKYVQAMAQILPWLDNRGLLDWK